MCNLAGHMKTLLWWGDDGISTGTRAWVAESTPQLFDVAAHTLAAVFESGREWDHLCVTEPRPAARQSQEWVSVFVQYKFLPVLLFWLGPVFSSFIWKNLWQEEFLSRSFSWQEVDSIRFGIFCCNCSCVRQCPLVLWHLCVVTFNSSLGYLSSPPFMKRQILGSKRAQPGVGESESLLLEEKTPLADLWLIVNLLFIRTSIHLFAVILWNNIGFDYWFYLKFSC